MVSQLESLMVAQTCLPHGSPSGLSRDVQGPEDGQTTHHMHLQAQKLLFYQLLFSMRHLNIFLPGEPGRENFTRTLIHEAWAVVHADRGVSRILSVCSTSGVLVQVQMPVQYVWHVA